ncbi:serine O-acetyltransferase [Candidatus Margulisiibacteriota bacterium]
MFNTIRAAFRHDPAARNILEILMYPGIWAIWLHKIAHALWWLKIPTIPRLISFINRFLTQIEIHPGAKLGKGFFIDHGCGIVIGETAEISENVLMYHQVTLGGTSREKGKRHPTIGNNVIIGAGAKILGNITIGDNCMIGAGTVITHSVPENCTVAGNPGRIVSHQGKKLIEKLDWEHIPDPIGKLLNELKEKIHEIEKNKK